MQRDAEPGSGDHRRLHLFVEDEVVAEVPRPAAAELDRDGEAQEPGGSGLGEDRPIDDAVARPVLDMGDHVLVEESPERVPEEVVLLVEERPDARENPIFGPVPQ